MELLTLQEVAERSRVSVREVKTWVEAGRLEYVILGKEVRVHPLALEDFWERNTIKIEITSGR